MPAKAKIKKRKGEDQFVWYKGKVWRYEGLLDRRGRVSIVSLKDSSLGKGVDPLDLTPVDEETHAAALWWLEKSA